MNVLFVTWDGPQVSYLEALFLPIFRRLAEQGWAFHVLQFTWGDKQCMQRSRQACAAVGVPYRSVRVWRKPVALGSLLTALKGASDVRRAVREWDIEVLMPRSTLPALACMQAQRGERVPMIFDADGLPLDERVDFGGMASVGLAYRLLRDIEAQAVRRADVVLTRTKQAADILLARAGAGASRERFFQVANGRDDNLFTPLSQDAKKEVSERLGIAADSPLVVYVGSLGEQYCLPEMLTLFEKILAHRGNARFLILTGSPDLANVQVEQCQGLKDKVVVRSVPPGDVPTYLASADLGLALRKITFSMLGVAPIKLGEYLLCGLPVIATAGVGDTSSISKEVGFLLNKPDAEVLEQVAIWFTEKVLPERETFRIRCRDAGLAHYSIETSVGSYRRALESISL